MSFLSSILPMVAGGALAATGVGAPAAAAMIGGLQYARTGSLNKGLMAGLGAYGGAGIGAGLAGAGGSAMNTAAAQATQAANPELMASEIGREMGTRGFEQVALAPGMDPATASMADKMGIGASNLGTKAGWSSLANQMGGAKGLGMAGLAAAAPMMAGETYTPPPVQSDNKMPQRLQYDQGTATPFPQPDVPGYADLGQDFGRQQRYFPNAGYRNITDEQAKAMRGYAAGGPIEQMSQANAVGMNTGYPQADITGHAYATPWQTPVSQNVVQGTADTGVNRLTGQMLARGGISDAQYNLGSYSDGGRLLKGPGDGVSDSIPATIGAKRQPARLADGEFVIPARIVSELGNGSTEAGAKKLYAMMDRVQRARGKTTGKNKVAANSRADKYLPA